MRVLGAYTSISFDVTLRLFSVDGLSSPEFENPNLPEYVAIQMYLPNVVAHPQEQVTPVNTEYAGSADVEGNTGNGVYSLASNPSNGTVTLNADGSFSYVPNDGFTGVDTFLYELCDPEDSANCAVSSVTITVVDALAETGPFDAAPFWALLAGLMMMLGAISLVVTYRHRTDPRG